MPDDPVNLHVSGLVVHARHAAAEAVVSRILALGGTTVPARNGGKLVVVLEAVDEQSLADKVNRISLMPDVYSAGLVYHGTDRLQSEGEGE